MNIALPVDYNSLLGDISPDLIVQCFLLNAYENVSYTRKPRLVKAVVL